MGDIALQFSEDGSADLQLVNDDIATDKGLRTAVLLSLFVDRQAEVDDPLPGADGDRRGWWADELAIIEGDKMGSRLWLLDRAKTSQDVPRRAEEFAREALAWLLQDRIAERVEVAAELEGKALYLQVTIDRPGADQARFRFGHIWDEEVARAA